jgi:hypothetical protein
VRRDALDVGARTACVPLPRAQVGAIVEADHVHASLGELLADLSVDVGPAAVAAEHDGERRRRTVRAKLDDRKSAQVVACR